jgi:hypothetical protein
MNRLRVLIACERSGTVRDAFLALGHDAISCDMQETVKPGPHYCGDVRHMLEKEWDLIIAHPPCTYLSNSGVCHLEGNNQRWKDLDDGCDFFRLFVDHPCLKKCIENPIPHKHAVERIGVKYTQLIQPWMFGHLEQKATCLWLYGLNDLTPTDNVYNEMMKLPDNERQRLFYLPPGPERQNERSKTFPGIAKAMAQQWSNPKQQRMFT